MQKLLKSKTYDFAINHMYDGCCKTPWPFATDNDGYPILGSHALASRRVQRVICEIVHGPEPFAKAHACHSCNKGHLGCFNAECIRWDTCTENNRDRIRAGYKPIAPMTLLGENNYNAKLTDENVREIRAIASSYTRVELAAKYGVHRKTISRIVNCHYR